MKWKKILSNPLIFFSFNFIILFKIFRLICRHFHLIMAPTLRTITGPCCDSADRILNESQGAPSHSQNQSGSAYGHPRFHVLCNLNSNLVQILKDLPHLGCTEAVTEQLRNTKTAFYTRMDQNRALHNILTSPIGHQAINMLNEGRNEVVLKIATSLFMPELKMTRVAHGNRLETVGAVSAVLILGHHVNKPEGMYVHVKTFYPTDRYIKNGYNFE